MSSAPTPGDLPWGRVLVLCAIQFVDVLSVTVTVTTLPDMLSDLDASADRRRPRRDGYAMFFGGLLLLGARLGDRFGHRRMLLCGIGLFAVGTLAAALAPTVDRADRRTLRAGCGCCRCRSRPR